ncbi:CPBP family intramembrane glutamic endopeptidase, partial [Kribbia dieselivorans]|uniref:CPBP family intramembrane glutamic endopeptidase n=1 Tax=Kribbia dieselivorans TaxID=331526 RepID=UPI0008383B3A
MLQQTAPTAPPPPDLGPVVEAEYHRLLRGPQHRWWRPLLSILLVGLIYIGFSIVLGVVMLTVGAVLGRPLTWSEDVLGRGADDPVYMLFVDASLIALIPTALLAIRLAHKVPMGFVSSVVGRFRWRWFATCLVALTPLWLVYVGIDWFAAGYSTDTPAQYWEWLVLMALVLTPLQCAGEEYMFRGWFMQSLGSWFANRWVALGVPLVLSVALFALAHGSLDIWILIQLATFATAATYLTWRTGGLEAAVALHTVNNVLVMILGAITGTGDDSLIDQNTTSSWFPAVIGLVVHTVAVLIVVWLARRQKITRTHLM